MVANETFLGKSNQLMVSQSRSGRWLCSTNKTHHIGAWSHLTNGELKDFLKSSNIGFLCFAKSHSVSVAILIYLEILEIMNYCNASPCLYIGVLKFYQIHSPCGMAGIPSLLIPIHALILSSCNLQSADGTSFMANSTSQQNILPGKQLKKTFISCCPPLRK